MIKKGDIVIVNARVYTARRVEPLESLGETLLHRPDRGDTCLFCAPVTPYTALVVGRSHLQTGMYFEGTPRDSYDYDNEGYEPPSLECDKAHIVLCVTPMGTERYLKPARVLEADVERVVRMRLDVFGMLLTSLNFHTMSRRMRDEMHTQVSRLLDGVHEVVT